MNEELIREIQELKKEKDAVILAHYYVDGSIQEIADYVGDSFALAKAAVEDPRKTIVFCGVTFMGQSASILNPDKTVLVPADDAVCPMALMVDPAEIREMREKYEDLAVVCYINSMAETKALVDVCVTSSNAVKSCAVCLRKTFTSFRIRTWEAILRSRCRRRISCWDTASAMFTTIWTRKM